MRRRKIKNRILIGLTYIAGFMWAFSACCLDSDTWIPLVVNLISLAWLALMAIANDKTIIKVK